MCTAVQNFALVGYAARAEAPYLEFVNFMSLPNAPTYLVGRQL